MFIHTHIAKYNSFSTGASQDHEEVKTSTKNISSASSCLSIMESLEGPLPQVRWLADVYIALIRTRQDVEQNITNLEETIRRSRNTEKVDDIQKYLSSLFPAFRGLDSLFEKLSGFTSCALDMDVEEQELHRFRHHVSDLWRDYGHAMQIMKIHALCCCISDAKLHQGLEYLQKEMRDFQAACGARKVQLKSLYRVISEPPTSRHEPWPKPGTITRRTTDPSGMATCHLSVVERMIGEVEQFKAIKKLLEKTQDQFYEQISEQDATKVRDAYITLEYAQRLVVDGRIARESYMEEEEEVLDELLAADDVSSMIKERIRDCLDCLRAYRSDYEMESQQSHGYEKENDNSNN
ncbi:predicted protein [Histoplasma mississippiense (nom. inval.)]|uniref:predicted protein n=1 Tax=Ajellomyces capsulatus (strain NAm1 / WU24) TaxID=2059318 RepID=UPI000157CEE4|nr:predicted protein [Histoplasma mississippiense (nom. inval.)]EDN11147.1 predicted protein [Histoplasma mississippiense (nom. inval.)]